MKSRLGYFSCIVSFCLLAQAGHAATEILLFRPADTVAFTVKSVSTRQQWIDTALVGTDSTFTTVAASMARTADGYRMVTRNTSFTGNRDGVPFDSSMMKVMSGLRVTIDIDTNGEATAITGFEGFFERIDSIATPQQAAALKQAFSPRLMSDKTVNEWNEKMARLAGRQMMLNALRLASDSALLPDDRKAVMFEASYISDTMRIKGRLHARVRVVVDTDPSRLARELAQPLSSVSDIYKIPESTLVRLSRSVSKYQVLSEFVVEVSTLLMASEQVTRSIVMKQVDLPEQQVQSRITETITRHYTYTKR